ncbi:MAG: serine/threonine protein kinase [Chloroflexota bacterium]|nr:serine/threonine protein kinase [Chloroflexota bacterium]
MEDRTGHWLAGRYRLDRHLATDKTGEWYEAWDGAALLQVVAHLLAPTMRESPGAIARYEKQADTLRALGLRALVAVRGIERDAGTSFVVQDMSPGQSLTALLAERATPFSPEEAARILRPVAGALDALHAAGIVHRQVAPETIMVGPDGGGILAVPPFVPPGMDAAVFGPSAFLSPEQSDSRALTGASDIYALGAVLYEMLAGRSPFTGEHAPRDVPETRRVQWEQMHHAPVALGGRTPVLSDWVDHALLSALNPNPAARPPSASHLIAAIAEADRDEAQMTAAIPHAGDTDATGFVPWTSDGFALSDDLAPDSEYTGLFGVPDLPERHAGGGRRGTVGLPVLAALTFLVIAAALVLGTLVVRRNNQLTADEGHYGAAESALGQGNYDAAVAEFGAAGTYRDAPARARAAQTEKEQRANYDAGSVAFDREDYTAAAASFGKAGAFRDATQRRADAMRLADQKQGYTDGQRALAQGDYETAAASFARAGDYRDAPQQAAQAQGLIGQQRQYRTGQDALTREDYATATAAFRAAGNFQDAPQQAMQAEKLRTQKAAYDAGADAFAREDYKTARQQFEAAANYKDAATRAMQANQEEMLLAKYTSAQTHLRVSQWKDAYADLQEIKKQRPDYKDVAAVIAHLENDVVNPTTVDLSAALNVTNDYKESWVPVNNLIGQPVTWLYIVARQSVSDARPDQISAISIALVAKQGAKEALNGETPVLAANSDLRDRNALRAGEKLFVPTEKGQTFETAEFGKYRARLTMTTLAFPLRIPGNDSAGTLTTFFSRLTVEVTLTPKTP